VAPHPSPREPGVGRGGGPAAAGRAAGGGRGGGGRRWDLPHGQRDGGGGAQRHRHGARLPSGARPGPRHGGLRCPMSGCRQCTARRERCCGKSPDLVVPAAGPGPGAAHRGGRAVRAGPEGLHRPARPQHGQQQLGTTGAAPRTGSCAWRACRGRTVECTPARAPATRPPPSLPP
jgi:hypothetical protein